MPMTWTPDLEVKLFAAVLETSEVKVNYTEVAEKLGPDCTAKAVQHRISAIKNAGKANGATPKAKVPSKRKAAKVESEDENQVDMNGPVAKKTVARAKPKPKATGGDADGNGIGNAKGNGKKPVAKAKGDGNADTGVGGTSTGTGTGTATGEAGTATGTETGTATGTDTGAATGN